MRYYAVVITDLDAGTKFTYTNKTPSGTWDPGGLQIELDISTTHFAEPFGASYVKITGVPLQQIIQSQNFNPKPDGTGYKQISVYGGMLAGLPLATPAQAGLLCQGLIQQCFGNWQGTETSLEFMIISGGYPNGNITPLITNWPAGTPMKTMITNTLNQAFPGYKLQINIKDNLVLTHDEQGFYGTMGQFAEYVQNISRDIINIEGYPGVRIVVNQNTFIIDDASTPVTPTNILFTDLIGQPTWVGPNQISCSLVLRGDLQVFDYIKLPPTQVQTQAQSYALYRQASAFQGSFQILSLRHIGNLRTSDASAWISTATCAVN